MPVTRSKPSMTFAAGAGKKCFTSMRELAITCDSQSMNARIERGRNGRPAVPGSASTASSAAIAASARRRAASPAARNASRSCSPGRRTQRSRCGSWAISPSAVVRIFIGSVSWSAVSQSKANGASASRTAARSPPRTVTTTCPPASRAATSVAIPASASRAAASAARRRSSGLKTLPTAVSGMASTTSTRFGAAAGSGSVRRRPRAQLVLGDGGAGGERDVRDRHLAGVRVRPPDGGGRGDRRVREQRVLDRLPGRCCARRG